MLRPSPGEVEELGLGGGVVGTTKYPTGYTYGTPCGTLVQSDGSAYKIVAPYGCYENVTVPGLKPIPY